MNLVKWNDLFRRSARRWGTTLLATFLVALFSTGFAKKMDFGRFLGSVRVEWVRSQPPSTGQDRYMRLLEDFTYIDPRGKAWTARKGYATDGASIPKAFWSIVGGPFEGGYREAAVIHDWYCDSKTEPWKDVHRIFYYACRAAGVSDKKAKTLYAAVRMFGPKWGSDRSNCSTCHARVEGYQEDKHGQLVNVPPVSAAEARRVSDWIKSGNPTLDQIDAYATEKFPGSKFGHE
jgi:hypothetical protein